MLRNLLDFGKKKTLKEAVIFYVFYVGCFVLVNAVLQGQI